MIITLHRCILIFSVPPLCLTLNTAYYIKITFKYLVISPGNWIFMYDVQEAREVLETYDKKVELSKFLEGIRQKQLILNLYFF